MVVNTPQKSPFSDVNQVGVAICTHDVHARNNHIGIIYKFGDNDPLMLHFTALIVDGNAPCSDDCLWLDLAGEFTDVERSIICAHAKKVADANPKKRLAWGYDAPGGHIDGETGEIIPALGSFGLTCATFVLEVFESCGYKLVDQTSWPKSLKDDIKWQEDMITKLLYRPDIDSEAISRQKKNVSKSRFLPEQIAAATQVKIPAVKGGLLKPAKKIRQDLKAHFKL